MTLPYFLVDFFFGAGFAHFFILQAIVSLRSGFDSVGHEVNSQTEGLSVISR